MVIHVPSNLQTAILERGFESLCCTFRYIHFLFHYLINNFKLILTGEYSASWTYTFKIIFGHDPKPVSSTSNLAPFPSSGSSATRKMKAEKLRIHFFYFKFERFSLLSCAAHSLRCFPENTQVFVLQFLRLNPLLLRPMTGIPIQCVYSFHNDLILDTAEKPCA